MNEVLLQTNFTLKKYSGLTLNQNLITAFENTKDSHFSCCSTSAFAFAMSTEVTLI